MTYKPMRRWLRWPLVKVLRFMIRRRPGLVQDLRAKLEQAFAHRSAEEAADIWHEACKGTWLERAN